MLSEGAPCWRRATCARFIESCCASSSSNFTRVHAGWVRSINAYSSQSAGGLCNKRMADSNGISCNVLRNASGSVSLKSKRVSALVIALRNSVCDNPSPAG